MPKGKDNFKTPQLTSKSSDHVQEEQKLYVHKKPIFPSHSRILMSCGKIQTWMSFSPIKSPDEFVLRCRLRCLTRFPSSPGPCLLAPSHSSLSHCLLLAPLSRASLTRLCLPATAVVQSIWEECRFASAVSSRCRMCGSLCSSYFLTKFFQHYIALLTSDAVFARDLQ